MGCAASSPELAEQLARSKAIQTELNLARKEAQKETKLLLLGAGESGKSTFAKQMKILHLTGFTREERIAYRKVICSNVMDSMLALVHGADDLGIEINDKAAATVIRNNENYTSDAVPQLMDSVVALWADAGIQSAFAQSERFQLMDNCARFVPRAKELASPDYVPDDVDILHSRMKTTGIIETDFEVGKLKFRMMDVGGQRSERKKWMHCFQDVTAIIFCVSLSEYNLKLDEDRTTNRMQESLRLFRQIVNTNWFKNTDVILFFNKRDIFEQKILNANITSCFPSYTGAQTFEAATDYIEKQFIAQCEDPKKKVYPHVTCATDSSNIAHVFAAVRDIIMQSVERDIGFE